MRARFVLGCFGGLSVALVAPWACIPHPDKDFEDYQTRIASFPKAAIEASTFEAAPPPTQATEGLYYGACLSELAFGQVKQVFNFYTLTKYVPDPSGQGGSLSLSIQPLKVINRAPPPTISKAGLDGAEIPAAGVAVDSEGRYSIKLGTADAPLTKVPGTSNPISGGDVEIENATLQGRFGTSKFCARLGGHVNKPTAAARQLDIEANVCQFVPIKDGDPLPPLTAADFQPAACPL